MMEFVKKSSDLQLQRQIQFVYPAANTLVLSLAAVFFLSKINIWKSGSVCFHELTVLKSCQAEIYGWLNQVGISGAVCTLLPRLIFWLSQFYQR